jgi:hypothetical protein
MFPVGSPGVALLVLRGCIVAALVGIAFPTGWQHFAFLGLLGMLCLGLLTPVVCGVAAAAVLLDWSHLRTGSSVQLSIVVLATLAYAFLGPGAYSVDARLFGRRILVSTDSSQSE